MDKQDGGASVFYQNKEMQTLYNPFKIVYVNDTIDYIQFKSSDALWSRNFKRAIASAFQLKSLKSGAFVEEEVKKLFYLKNSENCISISSFFFHLTIFQSQSAGHSWHLFR